MTVGEIKAELTKMLGNALESTGHPFVSPTDLRYRWIQRAANKIPRIAASRGLDLLLIFQELFGTWKDTTVHNVAYLEKPNDMLFVREVYSFDMLSANADVDNVRLIQDLPPEIFDSGRSSTEASGYPHSVKRVDARVYFRPLPVTGWLTDVHYYGAARETLFNNDNQTPMLREDWHEAIVFEAARIGAKSLGYWDRAKEYGAEVLSLVGTGLSIQLEEEIYDGETFDLAGLPKKWEIH